jgi:DNA-binding transcriptional LysR family regulator
VRLVNRTIRTLALTDEGAEMMELVKDLIAQYLECRPPRRSALPSRKRYWLLPTR